MTDFEQHVASALRVAILKVRELNSPEAPTAIAFALAPVVAAAIKAAADRALVAINIAELPPVVVHIEAAALAALRGER